MLHGVNKSNPSRATQIRMMQTMSREDQQSFLAKGNMYLVLKNEIEIFRSIPGEKNSSGDEVSQTQKTKNHMFSLICGL
jgi:hypothetical protein